VKSAIVSKGWQRRIVPVFIYLEKSTKKSFLHIRNDVMDFILSHWEFFHPSGTNESADGRKWRECVKALLRRRKDLFQSSRDDFGMKGFYRLLPTVDRSLYSWIDSPLGYKDSVDRMETKISVNENSDNSFNLLNQIVDAEVIVPASKEEEIGT